MMKLYSLFLAISLILSACARNDNSIDKGLNAFGDIEPEQSYITIEEFPIQDSSVDTDRRSINLMDIVALLSNEALSLEIEVGGFTEVHQVGAEGTPDEFIYVWQVLFDLDHDSRESEGDLEIEFYYSSEETETQHNSDAMIPLQLSIWEYVNGSDFIRHGTGADTFHITEQNSVQLVFELGHFTIFQRLSSETPIRFETWYNDGTHFSEDAYPDEE